jgi:4-amino-4-deoxy-L-arabinose transferase-like glycosyltransferase
VEAAFKKMELTEKLRDIIILIIIAGFILLWNLGTGSLLSWDEAVYAQVSKEMLISHNYIDLTWAGGPWSDKPPLYMWMTVIFYNMFGVNEFSARLFSALCGMGTVIVVYLFAAKLYSRRAAFAAALILLSTLHFIWASKVGMLDTALTFFISLSLYWFALGTEQKIYLFFSMLAFGCAFLTKSFAAVIIPLTLLLYMICAKKFKIIREPALWVGLSIAIFIVGLWHFMAFLHYKNGFIGGYLIKHSLIRVTQAVEGHTGSIFTYLKAIPNKGRPWGTVSFFVIPFALWEVFKKRGNTNHVLPLMWAFTTLALFTLVKTKLNWYITPIYPAIAILVGWGIDRILNKKTIIFVLACAIASLIYLTFENHIFNLDYSHETKKLALSFKEKIDPKEKVYVCDDGDPSVRFYFLDGRAIPSDSSRLDGLLKEKNSYIVLNKTALNALKKSGFSIIQESPELAIIKVN